MIETILSKQSAPAVEFRFILGRQSDGRTWTYQPVAWRTPGEKWSSLEAQPVTLLGIALVERETGYTMQHLGTKVTSSEWIYRFQKES